MVGKIAVGSAGLGATILLLVVHLQYTSASGTLTAVALARTAGVAGGAVGYVHARDQQDRSKEILSTLAHVRENQERVKRAAGRLENQND